MKPTTNEGRRFVEEVSPRGDVPKLLPNRPEVIRRITAIEREAAAQAEARLEEAFSLPTLRSRDAPERLRWPQGVRAENELALVLPDHQDHDETDSDPHRYCQNAAAAILAALAEQDAT